MMRALLSILSVLALASPVAAQGGGDGGSTTTETTETTTSTQNTDGGQSTQTTTTTRRDPNPPPEVAPATPPPSSGSEHENVEEEDGDGRDADIFWIEGGFGYSYADLVSFSQDNFIPVAERLSGSGFMGTLALGFRISFLTLGARASLSAFSDFDLGQIVLDAALRIPTPLIEPFARIGIGYGWVGRADYADPANSETSVFGLVAEVGAGLDIYLSDFFSIGAGMDVVFLNLTRQRVDQGCGVGGTDCMIDDVNFEEDGDAVGLQIRANGHAGLHF